MGKAESSVEDYLGNRVKATGGSIRKLKWIGRRGAADRLVWYKFPNCAFVEVKAPGKDIDWRSSQGREFRRMEADGWPCFVVSSHEQVDFVLECVRTGARYL